MLLKIQQVNLIVLFFVQLHFNCNGADGGPLSLACAVCTLSPFSAPPKHTHIFYHALVSTTGRDQHMAIHLLLLFLLQPFNGPMRAKHIAQCSSVIGQYHSPSRVTSRDVNLLELHLSFGQPDC